jgi:pimeloyl-ACP methyl ester carboxylesterase
MATTIQALRMAFSDTMRREFDAQDRCLAERVGPAQFAMLRWIPTRILARESYPLPERGAFEAMHRQTQRDWLQLTGAQQIDTVGGSGHYVHRDRPDAVIVAVEQVADSARGRGP